MALPVVPRRRRWPWVLFILFVAIVTLVWFAPAIVAKTSLRDRILRMATSDLKGHLSVSSMTLGWLSPIELTGVTLTDESGNEVVKIAHAQSEKTLFALARNQSNLGRFVIDAPHVNLNCTNDSTNLETVIAKYLEPSTKSNARLSLSLVLSDGHVVIRDEISKGQRTLDAVSGEMSIPATGPIAIQASATIPESLTSGSIRIDGELGGSLQAKGEEIPLDAIGWFARRFEPGLSLAGTASGSVEMKPGENKAIQVSGTIRATNVSAVNTTNGELFHSQSVDLKTELTVADSIITSRRFDLICDAGKAEFLGTLNLAESPAKWINRPGLGLKVDLDAMRLPSMLPPLRNAMTGTEVKSGSLTLNIKSVAHESGTTWGGTVGVSTLKAIRNGSPVVWEQPIQCVFDGRMGTNDLPTFDKLQIASDFVGLNFRGSFDQFEAAATVDLDRLSRHLADFMDMSGMTLNGRASIQAWNRPSGNEINLVAKMGIEQLSITDGKGFAWKEPTLKIDVNATGKRETSGAIRIDKGLATLTAMGDSATLELTQPIPDLRDATAGAGQIAVSGDITRWRTRLASVISLPKDWQTQGTIQASAGIRFSDSGAIAEQADVNVTKAQIRGMGMIVNDPLIRAKIESAKWERKSGTLTMQSVRLGSETIAAECPTFSIRPSEQSLPILDGTVTISAARLNRLAPIVGLSIDPRGSNAMDGMANGTIALTSSGGTVGFDAKLHVEQFRYGPAQNPTWTEPKVDLVAVGRYDSTNDSASFTAAQIVLDVLKFEGKGTVNSLSTRLNLDFAGNLTYDLAKIEPQVKDYLGRGGKVTGKDTRPIRISGSLANGVETITVAVGTSRQELLFPRLAADASVGWQSMRAYGFEVGPADLKANVEKGIVQFQPVLATFGNGRINAHPSLMLNSGAYDLSFAKGRMIENARLTPAACSDALGFALPAIANSTEAEGLISVDWDEGRIPLADYTRMNVKGRLIMHSVKLTPGPVIRTLLSAAGLPEQSYALANEQVVPVWVENGRVHHRDFAIGAKNFTVRTSGSVGFDGSMQLVCEVPIPSALLDQAFRNNPRIRDAMAKKTISVPLGGTVNKPSLDVRAFQASIQKMIGDAAKDAVKDAAGDLLKKELDKGLEKFLPKPPVKNP